MKNIIVDMDGTLADSTHRAHYAQQRRWEDFHKNSHEDPVREDVAGACLELATGFDLIIVTGRPEAFRQKTIDWLKSNQLMGLFDQLLMRLDNDFRPDIEMKIALLEHHFGTKEDVLENIAFCLDDRDNVVEGFRNYGLNCWQVKQGDY